MRADIGENFHIDIKGESLKDIIELAKLLPTSARINKGIGMSEMLKAFLSSYISANSKKGSKKPNFEFDWTAEDRKNSEKSTRLSALEQARKRHEELVKRK